LPQLSANNINFAEYFIAGRKYVFTVLFYERGFLKRINGIDRVQILKKFG